MKKSPQKKVVKAELYLAFGFTPIKICLDYDELPNKEVAKLMRYVKVPCIISYYLPSKSKKK